MSDLLVIISTATELNLAAGIELRRYPRTEFANGAQAIMKPAVAR
jgi:hypothetical protein